MVQAASALETLMVGSVLWLVRGLPLPCIHLLVLVPQTDQIVLISLLHVLAHAALRCPWIDQRLLVVYRLLLGSSLGVAGLDLGVAVVLSRQLALSDL